MLGLGWTEMLVIGVVALIFIGPKDLPVVMSRLGKVVGQIRRMGNEFQREINKTTGLDEVRNLRNSITAPLKKTTDEIRREFNAMTPSGAKPSGAIKPANPAVESVVDEIKAKAGMSEPAAPVSADEAAKAAGFKPAGPAPTTSSATFGKPAKAAAKAPATKKAPVKAKAAPTRPVITTDLAAADAPVSAAKTSEAKASAPSKPAGATKSPAAKKAVPRKPAAAKSAAATPAAASASDAATAAKAAPKKRAPAKPKPATAQTTADKAGDE